MAIRLVFSQSNSMSSAGVSGWVDEKAAFHAWPWSTSIASGFADRRVPASGSASKLICSDSNMFVARDTGLTNFPSLSMYLFRRVNHGCLRTSSSEKRDLTSTLIIPLRSDKTSKGKAFQSSSEGLPLLFTYSLNSLGWPYSSKPSVGRLQGVLPASKTKRTTPQDQMSAKSAE